MVQIQIIVKKLKVFRSAIAMRNYCLW